MKSSKLLSKHWNRLKRSLGRRYKEWLLPRGYTRLGTKYGGWWVDTKSVGPTPLLIDCGLGEDISFPIAFLERYNDAKVIGVEINPRSLAYCEKHAPKRMQILTKALWSTAGESLIFHLPRPQEALPTGADGVSGSLIDSHEYVTGGDSLTVETIDLPTILQQAGRAECDILKIDIEGAEYDVLTTLAQTGDLSRVKQLLIEFHHRVTHHTMEETEATVDQIKACGFKLIHVESRNYIFRQEPCR